MLGIVVIIIISGVLLYLLERENLNSIGLLPTWVRIQEMLIGFFLTALLCSIAQSIKVVLANSSWTINNSIDILIFLKATWWDLKSVMTEEFVFRGAVLVILIRRIGTNRAILLSAVVFGVYHWFSFGIWGSIIPMIFVFIGTGLMGYAFAYAFSKSKSILLPIGLHFGWNFTQNTIFSNGPLGDLVLMSSRDQQLQGYVSLIDYGFSMIAVPIIIILLIRKFVRS